MAIKGKLCVDGVSKSFTVVECEYVFNQTVDTDGLPNDGISGGQIIVTIVTPPKGNFIYDWMFQNWSFQSGYIEFITNVNSDHPAYHAVMFEDAKCVNLFEYFNNQNRVMMTTRLTLQCAKIAFSNDNEAGVGYDFRNKEKIEVAAGKTLSIADRDPMAPYAPYFEKAGLF